MASLSKLREEAAGCKACDLWKTGTQVVFGEGKAGAEAIFVGEQPGDQEDKAGRAVGGPGREPLAPGDQEDKAGRPFVGPAGKLFDQALADADIDREQVYVTNVVKHFKWVGRGKRRIHQKPNWSEIAACRPWLDAELAAVEPRVLVCLGANAAQALLGRQFRVPRERGKPVDSDLAEHVLATIHPSAILRGDPERREQEYAAFVADLQIVAKLL